MRDVEPIFRGRTFDDFLFEPQHSPVASRRAVDLAMPLTPRLGLGLPVVGANMDTVMGPEMARALALEGAIGFLHRACSVERQAEHERYVKSRHSYVIDHPVVLPRTDGDAELDDGCSPTRSVGGRASAGTWCATARKRRARRAPRRCTSSATRTPRRSIDAVGS